MRGDHVVSQLEKRKPVLHLPEEIRQREHPAEHKPKPERRPPQVPTVLRSLFGGERRARAMGLAIGLQIVMVLAIAQLTGRDGAKPQPAAAHRTPVTAVADGATPAEDAHNLATWILPNTR